MTPHWSNWLILLLVIVALVLLFQIGGTAKEIKECCGGLQSTDPPIGDPDTTQGTAPTYGGDPGPGPVISVRPGGGNAAVWKVNNAHADEGESMEIRPDAVGTAEYRKFNGVDVAQWQMVVEQDDGAGGYNYYFIKCKEDPVLEGQIAWYVNGTKVEPCTNGCTTLPSEFFGKILSAVRDEVPSPIKSNSFTATSKRVNIP